MALKLLRVGVKDLDLIHWLKVVSSDKVKGIDLISRMNILILRALKLSSCGA